MKKYIFYIIVLNILLGDFVMSQSCFFCLNKKEIDENYYTLLQNITAVNVYSDSCTLSLLDSLELFFLETNDCKYLKLLNAVSIYSDGYISEKNC